MGGYDDVVEGPGDGLQVAGKSVLALHSVEIISELGFEGGGGTMTS